LMQSSSARVHFRPETRAVLRRRRRDGHSLPVRDRRGARGRRHELHRRNHLDRPGNADRRRGPRRRCEPDRPSELDRTGKPEGVHTLERRVKREVQRRSDGTRRSDAPTALLPRDQLRGPHYHTITAGSQDQPQQIVLT
jgi:hypothetical protein